MTLRQMTRQVVTVTPMGGTDVDNKPTPGPPVDYDARAEIRDEVRRTDEGSEHVEVVVVYIDGDVTSSIERGDQLDAMGRTAFVSVVKPTVDGAGRVHHTKLVAE